MSVRLFDKLVVYRKISCHENLLFAQYLYIANVCVSKSLKSLGEFSKLHEVCVSSPDLLPVLSPPAISPQPAGR